MENKKPRPVDIYDKEDVYKAAIEPHVRDLMVRCLSEHLPMFISVAVKNTEEGTEYANNVVLGTTSVHLKDNRLAGILLYLNGFKQRDLPEDVEAALRTLQQYLSSIKGDGSLSHMESADVALTDDLLNEFCMITGGGGRTVV